MPPAPSRALRPDAAVVEGRVVAGVTVLVRGERIEDVRSGPVPADEERRVEGTLLPGAIDLQVNGAGGRGVEEATPEALDTVAESVLAGGATAFLPTLISAPFETLLGRLEAVAAWIASDPRNGARPLGVHVEGPFLELPGAHPPEHLVDPTPDRIDALLAAGGPALRLVTLAPDRPGAVDATRRLTEAGVCVALGHARGVEHLADCVAAGARMVTHLFNAMGPLHHRGPGLAGLALDDERLAASLILDGAHLHPLVARLAWRLLGPERAVLVTDSAPAAGMPDGDYDLSGTPVRVEGGIVRDGEGRLAGSSLSMRGAVQGLAAAVPGLSAADVARAISTNAARLLGDGRRGEIHPGAPAELCVLDGGGCLSALRIA